MNGELEFSTQAYCKIVMHVMKHCHTTCTGLLLAPNPKTSFRNDDDEPSNKLIITEAIPLFHGPPYLTPNFEIALNTVAVYAKHQQLCISGFYQAHKSCDDNQPDVFGRRITEKIRETSNNNAVLCVINNNGLETMQSHMILHPYQLVDDRWKPRPADTFTVEGDDDHMTKEILFSKEKLYRAIVDFDDHLENISLDWTNARVTQKIDYLCARIC